MEQLLYEMKYMYIMSQEMSHVINTGDKKNTC